MSPPRRTGRGLAPALAVALLVAGAARAGDAHPWDGLCLAEILEAGNIPVFALRNARDGDSVVFEDPAGGAPVAVTGCTREPWDWESFNADHVALQTLTHTAEEDPRFGRTVTYRHRRRGPTARISFYR